MSSDAPTRDLPLLDGLNSEQRAAVTLPPEHALILAGAGSGKTRVLTTRMAWLLQTGQVTPGGILAVTFTNKAAKEMLTRVTSMMPLNVRGMWIGTFHGLANRLLRAHHVLANLPGSFQILDTQDQLAAIKRLCKQYQIDTDRFPPRQMQWWIAGCKEEGLRPADVVAGDVIERRKVEIYQLYEDQCQREGVVDFGELMLRSYELLRDNEALRLHYRRRFRHILIDEFQDTNRLQYAWIKVIAGLPAEGGGGAVLAVGDDDQSIYAFRGARVDNMSDFVREFGVQHEIKLEQNYRSFSNILDSANALISHNARRLGKNLRTERGAGEPVRVYEAVSDIAEAQWLVQELRHLAEEEGYKRSELAVLYRSNAQSRAIETQLFNAGIPYRVYGGQRFFERAEIKHALAYLRLLENRDDDTSFLRVVNFPPRGIGTRTVEQLQDVARGTGQSLYASVTQVEGRAGAKLAGFVALVDVLREQTQGHTLREIIQMTLDASTLLEHYKHEKEGQDRIENLQELVNAAESFVTQEGFGRDAVALPLDEQGVPLTQSPASQGLDPDRPALGEVLPVVRTPMDTDTGETQSPLDAFLTYAALESGDNQAHVGQDAVQLMTVHASKGLEFDAVFITGLEEGLFPHENALSDSGGIEEERRLMYVAITRARKRLYLSHAQARLLHGQTRYNIPSRFLDELPEEAIKWLTPRSGGFAEMPEQISQRFAWSTPRAVTPAGVDVPVQSPPEDVLQVGTRVFHNRFGEGVVKAIEGGKDDARAQVAFVRHGTKWLVLSLAKLDVIR